MNSNRNINYTISDKKILIQKINDLKDNDKIKKVKQIIFKENPDLSFTKNSSGILLFFHNLNHDTYAKLDEYFTLLDQQKIDELTSRSNDFKSSDFDGDFNSDFDKTNNMNSIKYNYNSDIADIFTK